MPYLLDHSVSPFHTVRVHLEDKGLSWRNPQLTTDPLAFPAGYGGSRGVRIDGSVLCTRARATSPRKTLPPVFAAYARYAVNAHLKNLIESIEPGAHQFLPLETMLKDGSRPVDTYFIFNICSEIDAIDEVASVVRLENGKYWLNGMPPGTARMVLHQDRIAGRAAWYDKRSFRPFVCDELRDEIVRLKAKVVEFEKVYSH